MEYVSRVSSDEFKKDRGILKTPKTPGLKQHVYLEPGPETLFYHSNISIISTIFRFLKNNS